MCVTIDIMLSRKPTYIRQSVIQILVGGISRQQVRLIMFVCYNFQVTASEKGNNITPAASVLWDRVFKEVKEIIKNLDITNRTAVFMYEDNVFSVSLEDDLQEEHAQYILKKLREKFRVTYFECNTEYDNWLDTAPHVTFGFYEI